MWNRYWEKEESRKCELCGDSCGNLEHMVRECRELERGLCIEEIVSERGSEEAIECLRKLGEKRKETSREKDRRKIELKAKCMIGSGDV